MNFVLQIILFVENKALGSTCLFQNVYLDKQKHRNVYSMKFNLGKNLVLGKNPIKSNNIQS